MCVWGGKLEAYQLLQRSGKEPFSIKRVRTAGRANLECCSRSEGMDLVFLINCSVATAGKTQNWGFERGRETKTEWGERCLQRSSLSLPRTASVHDTNGNSSLSSPVSSQCQVACHPSKGPPGALIFLQELMSINCHLPLSRQSCRNSSVC